MPIYEVTEKVNYTREETYYVEAEAETEDEAYEHVMDGNAGEPEAEDCGLYEWESSQETSVREMPDEG